MLEKLAIRTQKHTEFVDITRDVQAAIREMGLTEGTATVYVPHTTAGVTIQENADPMVQADMIHVLGNVVPWKDPAYRHMEDNSAAHVKASMMGFSQTVLVEGGKIIFGTWQTLYFCEFDGPRSRTVYVKGMAG